MKNLKLLIQTVMMIIAFGLYQNTSAQRKMEVLDRGVLAIESGSNIYVGWRISATELRNVAFNVYRDGTKINSTPITGASNYLDTSGSSAAMYSVSAIIDGIEQPVSDEVPVWTSQYLDIPINETYGAIDKYELNDASVGDLDGDGQYEVIIKRVAADQSVGATYFNLIEAYKLDGTYLWTIDMGPNINDKTELNFLVYDFDGDGKAEVATRTSDGFTDGTGTYVGDRDGDGTINYRYSLVDNSGTLYRTEGPDYVSIFEGATGKELAWDYYIELDPISQWGTPGMHLAQYAHRANKCMWTVAYLDGKKPSMVNGRGIYHRIKMEAWDWDGTNLTKRWAFDSDPGGVATSYTGQGNHNLSCGDVDNDGCDEIVYGAMVVNNDGSGLYSTGFGHGDALHVSDMDPDRPGLETWQCLEGSEYWGVTLRSSADGELHIRYRSNRDCGRCAAGDINPDYDGWEVWGATESPMYNVDGEVVGANNVPMNYMIWWDGDLSREFMDYSSFSSEIGYGTPQISKYNPSTLDNYAVLTATGMATVNHSKGNPCLQADVIGDWREEMIVRSIDNSKLRIYTSTDVTDFRMPTLMHEPQYRIAVAWQNNSYNQPPHTGIYLGNETEEAVPYPIINDKIAWVSGPDWGSGSSSWNDEDGNSISYSDGANVLFDYNGNNTSSVNITNTVSPRSVTVFSQNDYTFEGTGKLSGDMELIKAGTGTLILNSNHDYTGTTKLYNGKLIINQAITGSKAEVGMFGELLLNGTIGNGVTVMSRGKLKIGSTEGIVGNGVIQNGLTLNEGSKTYFDLTMDPVGTNDAISLSGDLTIEGICNFYFNRLEGSLDPGSYDLITFDGTFNGSVDDIQILNINDVACQLVVADGKLTLEVLEVREATDIIWTGGTSNIWDFAGAYNWLNSDVDDWFLGNDNVTFNDDATRTTVNITEIVPIGSMVVNASSNFTFDGEGMISGTGGLTKSGFGQLKINNVNDFTGPVSLNGGLVQVSYISNSGMNGPLGAATGEAENFTINGSLLYLSDASFTTNRDITIGANDATIYTSTGITMTMDGSFAGEGELIKDGTGTLSLSETGTHAGTVINSGSVLLNSETAEISGLGSSVTLKNATLKMFNSAGSYSNIYWDLIVPNGFSATLNLDSRCSMFGSLTGDGTLNLDIPYIRSELFGDWSAFTGQINATTTNDGWLILGNINGYANAAIDLGDNIFAVYRNSNDDIIEIGELTGSSSSKLGSGGEGSNTITWKIGGLGTSVEFNGVINNTQFKNSGSQTAIIKTGGGRWTLTGNNTYTGGTVIERGSVIAANSFGSATGTGAIEVMTNASLAGTGSVAGAVTLNNRGYLLPGLSTQIGTLTLNSDLTILDGGRYYIKVDASTVSNDKVVVNGTAVLNGTLYMTLTNGAFANGQSFNVLDANAITGSFTAISPTSPGTGLYWDTTNLYTTGIIAVTDTPTGIFDADYSGVHIYPNPSDDNFNIDLSDIQGKGLISIENLEGSVVLNDVIEGGSVVTWSLGHLPTGVYLVKIQINNEYYINKIIVS
ncbi:autotransporter-associated beta strand repeat-containing protein [Carboxylicivirga caseinilyticus]|uniref:rhamnogalacturonan lyase family protein n=1 Tax=Carboxylicivirga caseinilyticus TaxID=3417572 RepID=UPI003D3465F9|nr:autotransporter-associated beta strand repeat-containing protein [Marinilabiliaceae bacterium A049]